MSLIQKIDDGLAKYYEDFPDKKYYLEDGTGKFAFFVEESGFEDDGIEDELKQKPDESTILEFDEEFPFDEDIDAEDEDACNIEIHRILNDIAKYGAPRDKLETMELKVDICSQVNDVHLQTCIDRYTSQVELLHTIKGGDGDLRYFLAVGDQQNYPFLANMVDSYTKENAEHHFKTQLKKKQGKLGNTITTPFTVTSWLERQNYFRAIHRKYPRKADQLKSAMRNYTNRIMNRLLFTPTFKINDDLANITQYIAAAPEFIYKLLKTVSAPFQMDLIIAVRGVTDQVNHQNNDNIAEEESDDDDDEDDDRQKELDPKIDHVGFVQNEFKKRKSPIYYAPEYEISEEKGNKRSSEAIQRILGDQYKKFRTVLSGDPPNKLYKGKSKYFDAESYPRGRRFSVFVDRRANKPTKAENDELTIFEPPNDCNNMKDNHVPEIGFGFLAKCLIPKVGQNKNISAKEPLCGQLLTFMFNVEASDEIKCYLLWCGQTMRFHGDHISKVLPFIFMETEENKQFIESKEAQTLQDAFDKYNDRKFLKFYTALKNFGK